jgi:hypothetical protein
MNRRFLLFGALALSSCATVGAPKLVAPAGRPLAELEPLYMADARRDGITIRVSSNGCTAKTDFAAYVERGGCRTALAFGRKHVDTCKSFAIGHTDLTFSWTELGVAPRATIVLLNPLTAWTGPGG